MDFELEKEGLRPDKKIKAKPKTTKVVKTDKKDSDSNGNGE